MSNTNKRISFAKLSCGGNDFIIIDERDLGQAPDHETLTKSICHRTMGVGADGTIFLQESEDYPFFMKLHNADGGAAEVSYNGSRCLGLYATQKGIVPEQFSFDSAAGVIHLSVTKSRVSLAVPDPGILKPDIVLESPWGRVSGMAVNAGVPYFIIPVENPDNPKLEEWAKPLKKHSFFANGTNVAIVDAADSNPVKTRFFERGVDEETMSSGTGTVAVALWSMVEKGIDGEVVVSCAGGSFPVCFMNKEGSMTDVTTEAEVSMICSGKYYLP